MNFPRRLAVLALISISLTVGWTTPAYAAKSKIGILVFDGFLTSDVTAPLEVLGAAGRKPEFPYEVVLVSATREKGARSEEGLRVIADNTIYDPLTLDVLIVPSSYHMDGLLENRDLIDFIRKQSRAASWMASNCSGAQLLGEAGVLDGKDATTWAGGEKALAARYPKIKVQSGTNVVVGDKVITSNGGPVSYQAAFALLAKLSSEKLAHEISLTIQFDRLKSAFK